METIKDVIQRNCVRVLDAPGVNITELARLTKISPSTIHKWKTGIHAPEAGNIEKLAEALKISPLEFYKAETPASNTEPISIFAKRILNIPDAFFDAVKDLDLQDEDLWRAIIGTAKGQVIVKNQRREKTLKKDGGENGNGKSG